MIKNVSYLESSVDIVIDILVRGGNPTFLTDRKCYRMTFFLKISYFYFYVYEWDLYTVVLKENVRMTMIHIL